MYGSLQRPERIWLYFAVRRPRLVLNAVHCREFIARLCHGAIMRTATQPTRYHYRPRTANRLAGPAC